MVRIAAGLLLIFCLAGCHRGVENNDAVRQGVLDYLATKGMTAAAMDINVASVKFDGDKADATVSFAAREAVRANDHQYHLEMKDNKWVVVGRRMQASTGLPGALRAAPQGDNPHGAPCSAGRGRRMRRRRTCRLPAKK
jgi:hypothetical protein